MLAYLKNGGDIAEYWKVLANNKIDYDRLASYERPITHEPWFKPELIPDFQKYLLTLKKMHSTNDLDLLIQESLKHVDNQT